MGQPIRIGHAPTGEPRFDLDVVYGEQGEAQVALWLRELTEGQVEVKHKRRPDLWFYVETHCDRGRRGTYEPSGISITTARRWAYVVAEVGMIVWLDTALLREMLETCPSTKDAEEMDGDCPTRGKLVDLVVYLYRYRQRRQQRELEQASASDHCAACGQIVVVSADAAVQEAWNYGLCLACCRRLDYLGQGPHRRT